MLSWLLEARLGEPIHSIAAPFGIVDERFRRVIAACDYRVGFSSRPGLAWIGDDPLNLPRIEVYHDLTEEAFLSSLEIQIV